MKVAESNQDSISANLLIGANLEAKIGRYALPKHINKGSYIRVCPDEQLHRHGIRLIPDSANQRNIITIHLCDDPSICAFRDTKLVDTSCGYSAAGGLPGLHTSGMIDPSIPMMLRTAGLSSGEIAKILLDESGFQSIDPSAKSILEKVTQSDLFDNLVRKIFIRNLLKEIGECLASLSWVDSIIFFSEEESYLPFVVDCCKELSWINLDLLAQVEQRDTYFNLSTVNSQVKAFFVHI